MTGLIRPDGVILAGLVLCSVLFGVRGGWADQRKLILTFGLIFGVFGGWYFLWRIHYFGYPFPNPYYVKHATAQRLGTLKNSIRSMIEMLLPVLPIAALGFRSRSALRATTIWLITIVPFTAVWMMISGDNNHFSRFQYIMIPISLLTLGGFAATWWRELDSPAEGTTVSRRAALTVPMAAMFLILCAVSIYYNGHLYRDPQPFSNRGAQDLAARLKPYASKRYTMVVTEAGDLPFYSEWKAVDALGLNDAFVAHHGRQLTEAYLDSYRPELILYRAWGIYHSPEQFSAQLGGPRVATDDQLTMNDMLLDHYSRQRGYVLAAVYGAELCLSDVYWVRSDFADRDAILSAIRDHPYYTQTSGQLAHNFAGTPAPTVPCRVQ